MLTWLLSLAGPPLTEKSAVATLLEHNVTVALGRDIASDARYARFDAGWVSKLMPLSLGLFMTFIL